MWLYGFPISLLLVVFLTRSNSKPRQLLTHDVYEKTRTLYKGYYQQTIYKYSKEFFLVESAWGQFALQSNINNEIQQLIDSKKYRTNISRLNGTHASFSSAGLEPYEEDEEFSKLLDEKLEEHKRDGGNTHSRILAVNSAHREMANRKLQKKAQTDNLDVMDEIINNNIAQDFDYFEGDLILDKDDLMVINHKAEETLLRRKKRNAIYHRHKLWVSRTIPFAISRSLRNARSVIYEAMNEFHRKTCLRFREIRDGSRGVTYIRFINGQGCFSKIGKRYVSKGPQELSLGRGCKVKGTVLHELTHSIGFFHEQSRPDRDKYIKINWENVIQGKLNQFNKYSHGTLDTMNVAYDYDSLMHYGDKTFSANGKKTIERIDGKNIAFGNKEDTFSAIDLVEINSLYDCRRRGRQSGYSSWSHWAPCDENCYRERQRFCFSLSRHGCPGANAYGVQTQKLKCGKHECPVPINGHWGAWGEWSKCTKTCDQGTRSRRRWCDNPKPMHGGRKCPGNFKEHSECQMRRCSYGPYDTEFEDGWGSWKNDPTADIPWTRQNHLTLTGGTGVNNDHTMGSDGGGYFIFTESSRRKKGDKARLVSPYIPPTSGKCLTFYYSMNGKRIGDLDVWLKPLGNKQGWVIFTAHGNKGPNPEWRNGYGNAISSVPFKLVFEATLGGPNLSDFALDDIMLVDGKCQSLSTPTVTKPMQCVDHSGACPLWESLGQCTSNPTYMLKECYKSCSKCAACRDTYSDQQKCKVWARKGECTKNPNFMRKSCKKSCGGCKKEACKDITKKCAKWAIKDECRKNKVWMKKYCCRSCKNLKAARKALSCVDKNVACSFWAKKRECKKNPTWMLRNCKKSCKKC